eukprot:TRINITY_DN4127_c0_g1_i1.p1 TRINITY_DN4127_c0_g1~~TRINITY_DN4127_c0_g1_i1.p1  ORF type:complete len:124 (+),score=15.39 TRINITY_DN4127_c0_g1_i1:65-436(+)
MLRVALPRAGACPLGRQVRTFSATAPLLLSLPRRWHPATSPDPLKLINQGKGPSGPKRKKIAPSILMQSAAGHPWFWRSQRRYVAAQPEKISKVGFDPVVQRYCLFHEKKDIGCMKAKKKFTQ